MHLSLTSATFQITCVYRCVFFLVPGPGVHGKPRSPDSISSSEEQIYTHVHCVFCTLSSLTEEHVEAVSLFLESDDAFKTSASVVFPGYAHTRWISTSCK